MTIMIFGGTGSLGKKLIERYLLHDDVFVYSRDEAKHWTIRNEILASNLEKYHKLTFIVGDIRDKSRVSDAIFMCKPDTIIIAAALKQVDTCELSPGESIATNLQGTQNVVAAVNNYNAINHNNSYLNVLFVSTDKACAPVNVYGMCKAISERVVTSQPMQGNVKFICTRYGNVLESRGSIIPLFKYQAQFGSSLSVTDPNMTRYVMTLDESVDLIDDAIRNGSNGDTWIPKLTSMRIGDLAEIFSEKYDKPIKIVGLRPGEKMHEELINESESVRCGFETPDRYVLRSASAQNLHAPFKYTSADDVMSKKQLHLYLNELGIIDAPLESFKGRSIEEIAK